MESKNDSPASPFGKAETPGRATLCGFDSGPASWAFLAAPGVVACGTGARRPCAQRARRIVGPASQATITVRAGDDLQAAIDDAHYGDTVIVEAGATFVGPLRLRDKGPGSGGDADYITIRTSDLFGIAKERN